MLNYLDVGSRSDIAYATHQCARFAADPKKEHGKAVQWIGRYLNGTKEQGMIFTPDSSLGLEVYVDADFAGNWNRDEAPHDRDTARSRHGYIIKYMGCVEKSVFSIWVDLLLCRSIQLLVLSYAEMFVYMYLSQLMSTFTNYLKVHHLLDGFFNP